MTPEEAEVIVYEFGDCLERQLLLKPEEHGAHLRSVSRDGLRKAIILWVAKQKYEGADILHRRELPNGERRAVLEIADGIWDFAALYGPLVDDGLPASESEIERQRANTLHDDFVQFILDLNPTDPEYWNKVQNWLRR